MRFILQMTLAAAIALGTGFGLSYFALTHPQYFGGVQIGPWQAWPAAGAPNPDPYTLAHLARHGGLHLGRAEGIEFVAMTDSDGQRLDARCTYRVDGRTPIATFWTLVAANEKGVNIAAMEALSYLDSQHINRAADGSTVLMVSQKPVPGNWLEISGSGPFQLILRLYDTAVFSGLSSDLDALPAILKQGCAA